MLLKVSLRMSAKLALKRSGERSCTGPGSGGRSFKVCANGGEWDPVLEHCVTDIEGALYCRMRKGWMIDVLAKIVLLGCLPIK